MSGLNMFLSEDRTLLDLTGNQLKDLSGISVPDTLTELDLTTNRIQRIDAAIGQLENLQKLSFRQNLINDSSCAELSSFGVKSSLMELIFRDNQIKVIPFLSSFPSLRILDLSYNEISSMVGLSKATKSLVQLYLANNAIPEIVEIGHLTQLQLLELGSNKIRVMKGLETFTGLQELWLGRNKIREVNLAGLSQLKKISVQSNRLTSMKGFESCKDLEELYLSHNGISEMEGLEELTRLKVLDVAGNRIRAVQGLITLTKLEDLWMNDNLLESVDLLVEALEGPRLTLTTIYVERNPCTRDKEYVPRLKAVLPNVEQIDGHMFQ